MRLADIGRGTLQPVAAGRIAEDRGGELLHDFVGDRNGRGGGTDRQRDALGIAFGLVPLLRRAAPLEEPAGAAAQADDEDAVRTRAARLMKSRAMSAPVAALPSPIMKPSADSAMKEPVIHATCRRDAHGIMAIRSTI